MHLLTETAMVDSKEYEILSFEEVEKLKRERLLLRNRVEATRKKLSLETKLRDAAQSLNRLYSTKGRTPSGNEQYNETATSPRSQRRSLLGSRRTSTDAQSRANDEYALSSRKAEELNQELVGLERRLDEIQRRILEHTAGVLQLTHKGLKKNIRKQELPRSPESMMSDGTRAVQPLDTIEDFDERSLYHDSEVAAGGLSQASARDLASKKAALEGAEQRLNDLSRRIHDMVHQADPEEHVAAPPMSQNGSVAEPGSQIQSQLGYLAVGLDAMEAAQAKTVAQAQKFMFDSEDHLEDVNVRLQELLQRTDSTDSKAAAMPQTRGKSMQSQLNYSSMVLDRLNERVDAWIEQKDILNRQIQQQRDLNSKSDNQRDTQISSLTQNLTEAKRLQAANEKEAQSCRDQINIMMEQLDLARQENSLMQQQKGMQQDKALQSEKEARRQAEQNLLSDLRTVQDQHSQLQATYTQFKNDSDLAMQSHTQQMNELTKERDQGNIELDTHRTVVEELRGHLQKTRADLETHKQTQLEQQQDFSKQRVAFEADTAASRGVLERLTQEKEMKHSELQKSQEETRGLEAEFVRVQTELTVVKAELDAAHGTRAQRAADASTNAAIQKQLDDHKTRNVDLQKQLDSMQSQAVSKRQSEQDVQKHVETLEKELRETIGDYEYMTKASIDFEKERDQLEASIDELREKCDGLETQLSDEKMKQLGARNNAHTETTSTMVLKNEFKKMMRESRAESIRTLKVSWISLLVSSQH